MSLKNRVKKIEETIKPKGSNFCDCWNKYITSQINQVYEVDDDGNPLDQNSYPLPDLSAKICNICQKPMEDNTSKVVVINSINQIYGNLNPENVGQINRLDSN